MRPSSRKSPAPFGVATKRFNKIGFHPQLDVSGAMKREITKTGPGSYNPKFVSCKERQGVSWKTKLESEEFSKFLGYRNADLLHRREFDKTMRGPGSTDPDDDFYKKRHFSVIPNSGFGTGDRFHLEEGGDGPPPVTYQPFRKLSTLKSRQFSNVMSFEWDGFLDRFRTKDPPYLLAPTRYNIKDGKGLDRLPNKVVSIRGPYDLFTGPRDGTTIKNHFTPGKTETPEYGYIQPTNIDVLLHHSSKQRCGKFLKGPRYTKKPTIRSMLNDLSLCYRDPDDPGPDRYDMSSFKSIELKQPSLYPFDTSKLYARPPIRWTIFPGPGRYNPKPPKCSKLKHPSWVFLCKGDRNLYKVVKYSDF